MNIVCIGAHPDDCEVFAGGTAVKWARQGHHVLFVSLTNGDAGHFAMHGPPLAERRLAEARLSAERAGIEPLVLPHPDGELLPTLEVRKEVVCMLRERKTDLVLTHRPNDYHPDHRYTALVVQDAAFLVTVPGFCPQTTALAANPVFGYFYDPFTKPAPFRAGVAVAVDEVMDVKWGMLDAMESQFYEWLPWLDGQLEEVPKEPEDRKEWLIRQWTPFFRQFTIVGYKPLRKRYGAARARHVKFAEVFEISEYGRRPSPTELKTLFPFR